MAQNALVNRILIRNWWFIILIESSTYIFSILRGFLEILMIAVFILFLSFITLNVTIISTTFIAFC